MANNYFIPVLLSAFATLPAAAQQPVPPPKKLFLDSAFVVLPSATGARYRREIAYADSVGGEQRDYYLSSNQLQSKTRFENFQKRILQGTSEIWYPSGQLKWHEEYAHGQLQGERRLYYPTGQLKRRETYAAGRRTAGECFGADGAPVAFFAYKIMPVYPEGDGSSRAIVEAVARRVQYPKDALRANVTGRVLVSFVVNRVGEVTAIKVVQSVSPSIDQAAVQAVSQLQRFTPGQQDGQAVNVSLTVPITFTIGAPRSLFGRRTTYELPAAKP